MAGIMVRMEEQTDEDINEDVMVALSKIGWINIGLAVNIR